MSSSPLPPDADMPSLEAAPLLFTLTHLSEAAAAARPNQGRHGKTQTSQAGGGAAAGGRPGQGQKRSRARREDDEEEEEDQHDEEDDDTDEEDEDSADEEDAQESHPFMASAVSAAVPASSLPSEASSSGALVGVSAGWTDGDVDAVADSSLSAGRVRLKKEADIDGVARAEFPIVQTIHATAWLGREVDVKTIARRCNNAVFVPPSCVRFTIRHPFGIAMVYASGKYVCLGGKSTVDMVTIARKVARKVQRIGNQPGAEEYKETIGFHNFSLNNISASGALGYRLNLRALSEDPAFMDYTEYEPEQWKGLHYRLPVDPTKTLADLLPSYAFLLAQRQRSEQFSDDHFLGTGEHATTKGGLNYYATTTTTGTRAALPTPTSTGVTKTPFKVPPSLHGQILTATIYSNGRLTLTGVRREKDVHDAFLRLWSILQPFATSRPAARPPVQPAYPRAFRPGQRRRIKEEEAEAAAAGTRTSSGGASRTAAEASFPLRDIKPNVLVQPTVGVTNSLFVLPTPSLGVKQQPVSGTFAVKAEHQTSGAHWEPTDAMSGRDANSAIVLEGLPEGEADDQTTTAAGAAAPGEPAPADDEVEWE